MRFVKVVDESKRQLEKDPNFRSLAAIPDSGLTITLPTLMSAGVILVVVPYAIKAEVVAKLMKAPISPSFPASILKGKENAVMYQDPDSARNLRSS